jgi:hypothetical protein
MSHMAGIVSKSQKIPEFRLILEFATDRLAGDQFSKCCLPLQQWPVPKGATVQPEQIEGFRLTV